MTFHTLFDSFVYLCDFIYHYFILFRHVHAARTYTNFKFQCKTSSLINFCMLSGDQKAFVSHLMHDLSPALVEVREDLVLELAQRSHGSGSKSKGFENGSADVLSSLATWPIFFFPRFLRVSHRVWLHVLIIVKERDRLLQYICKRKTSQSLACIQLAARAQFDLEGSLVLPGRRFCPFQYVSWSLKWPHYFDVYKYWYSISWWPHPPSHQMVIVLHQN